MVENLTQNQNNFCFHIEILIQYTYLCLALNLDQNTKQKIGVRLTLLQENGRNMSIFLVNTFISFFEFVSNFPPF